jgi:hypothetical protein
MTAKAGENFFLRDVKMLREQAQKSLDDGALTSACCATQ